MNVNFGRIFSLNINLTESELYDLLLELQYLDKSECDQLANLEENIKKSIENNKGYTMVTTE